MPTQRKTVLSRRKNLQVARDSKTAEIIAAGPDISTDDISTDLVSDDDMSAYSDTDSIDNFDLTIEMEEDRDEEHNSYAHDSHGGSEQLHGYTYDETQRHIANIFYIQKTYGKLLSHQESCPGPLDFKLMLTSVRQYGSVLMQAYTCEGCCQHFTLSSDPDSSTEDVFHRNKPKNTSLDVFEVSQCNPSPMPDSRSALVTKGLHLNNCMVWAALSVGLGLKQMQGFFSYLGVQMLSSTAFIETQTLIGKSLQMQLFDRIIHNGEQEKQLAISEGRVDSDGKAYTDVIVDGCWSHRSYGHRYSSLSGAACIISKHTQQLLYLGVKNKFCLHCCLSVKAGQVTDHDCFKNHSGTSTSMESEIVCQGFQFYENIGLRFYTVIGDDDSSVYKKIQQCVPYGGRIEKKLCANHVVKNFTSRLYKIQTSLRSSDKSLFTSNKIQLIKGFARKCIALCEENNLGVSELERQLDAIPKHIVGSHDDCIDVFCSRDTCIVERLPDQSIQGIREATAILRSKAPRIVGNETSNLAESLMSQIGKLSGGKIYNRCLRGRYQFDCNMAGLQFKNKFQWAKESFANTFGKPMPSLSLKYIDSYSKDFFRKQDPAYKKNHNLQRAKRRRHAGHADDNYGNVTNDPPPSEDPQDLATKCSQYLATLVIDAERQCQIEQLTRSQSSCQIWRDERGKRLTASNFGRICKMRTTTSCCKAVIDIVYNRYIKSKAIEYGKSHEQLAIIQFEQHTGLRVQPSRLWIDIEEFYLAASPDGIVNNESLIEVKCPYTIRNSDPILIATDYYAIVNIENRQIKLNRNHNYFYQIQGQLHITNKKNCFFIVWTPLGIAIELIQRDDVFWRECMITQLSKFYKECILPELAVPRHPFGFPVRGQSAAR